MGGILLVYLTGQVRKCDRKNYQLFYQGNEVL